MPQNNYWSPLRATAAKRYGVPMRAAVDMRLGFTKVKGKASFGCLNSTAKRDGVFNGWKKIPSMALLQQAA
jgi:hypothetical protein